MSIVNHRFHVIISSGLNLWRDYTVWREAVMKPDTLSFD